MIRRSNATCLFPRCHVQAVWGSNWIPEHCETHKREEEINLVERPCSECKLMYILDTQNFCENCNPESFARARLAKQNALMDFLDFNGLPGDSTDVIIDQGVCGYERPDRVFDFGDKIVILECDEDQHKSRQCLCEQTRMVNLGQSFGGIPVYFIRWNPDDYYSGGKKDLDPEPVRKRHELCCKFIKDIRAGNVILPTNAMVAAIYLYYNEWTTLKNETWKTLTNFDPDPKIDF